MDCPGEGGAVGEHLVEEGFVGPESFGDDPQDTTLQVGDAVMEVHQEVADTRQVVLGKGRRTVAVGILRSQRVAIAERCPPVEHLLPVGYVGDRRRLDQQARVAALPVGARHDIGVLALLGKGEERLELRVRLIDEIDRQVVFHVDEAGGEAAKHTIDDRTAFFGASGLEGE